MTSAPGTHTQAGRLIAARASSQTAPRIVQSRAPAGIRPAVQADRGHRGHRHGDRHRRLRPAQAPGRTRGISQAAATSMPSHTARGTAGCR